MDRSQRAHARSARVRDGPDSPQSRHPADQRRAAAVERAAPVDHRHLRLPGRRPAHHDGHARGSHRPSQAPAGWRSGLRPRIAAGGLLAELRDAHRQPGHHGHRRSHGRPLDPLTDLHDVPGSEAADHGHRGLDRRLLGGWRHRAGPRRPAAGVLLVGLGVPHRRPRDGPAAHPGSAHPPRVPGPGCTPAGRLQRSSLAARDPWRGLRTQGDRAGRDGASCRSCRSSSAWFSESSSFGASSTSSRR